MKRPVAHTRALTPGLGRCHPGGGGGGAQSSRASAEGESRPPAGTAGVSGCQAGVRGAGAWAPFIPEAGWGGRPSAPGETSGGVDPRGWPFPSDQQRLRVRSPSRPRVSRWGTQETPGTRERTEAGARPGDSTDPSLGATPS